VVSVIGSTMRLLLHRRRSEVEVLKLVGATDGFVRRPFVVEGAAQGAAGAGAALLLLGGLFLIVRGHFDVELVGDARRLPLVPPLVSGRRHGGPRRRARRGHGPRQPAPHGEGLTCDAP
jgi:predicted lysophospholipase L1 biosynthesis ABC-type transport system permease subunit